MTYATINEAMLATAPGDVVEVSGDQTYTGTIKFPQDHSGTADAPITVRGIKVNGKRPILRGIGPGQYDNMAVFLNANYFVLESFEVIGGGPNDYCIVNKADHVTLRDLVVHDCPHQGGLVGNDSESGSLTLEYSEFYKNGTGESSHQIYMATDEDVFPRSTFRMQYCYVHDGTGGNNVKSRSERNEIYYNWIEGAMFHELDLIGPDVGNMGTAREDSDVVGNVLIKTSEWRIARIGGDGSGNTAGRYRFVNNTMVLGDKAATAIGLQETVESLEMFNNVIYRASGAFKVFDINEPSGPATSFFGSHNWLSSAATNAPPEWTNTVMGGDPGWVDAATNDYRPKQGSALVDAGSMTTAATGALAFPSPLLVPAFNPPQRRLVALGAAEKRTLAAAPDIGAFEQTAAAPGAPPPPSGTDPGPTPSGGASSGGTSGGSSSGSGDGGGCGCHTSSGAGHALGDLALVALGLAALRRRRRPSASRG
jgi:MYXO-CTERM domain-containing protein